MVVDVGKNGVLAAPVVVAVANKLVEQLLLLSMLMSVMLLLLLLLLIQVRLQQLLLFNYDAAAAVADVYVCLRSRS